MIPEEHRGDPGIRRTFIGVLVLLSAALLLGAGAVVVTLSKVLVGETVSIAVWTRTFVVVAITASLFYFLWRAWLGWYWAYQRLSLFARVFPIVALATAAIPGLYPAWMVSEQILVSVVMIGIAFLLMSERMRAAYCASPTAAARTLG